MRFPETGQPADRIAALLDAMKVQDARWREGVPSFQALNAIKMKTGEPLDARPDMFPVLWRRA